MKRKPSYCANDLADINTPLLYNYWYVIGLASEITRNLKERTILNRSLVIYRDEEGGVVVLQNRCAHRSFPLAESTLEEGGIRCKYHGIKYDHDGNITDVPCQENCPRTGIKKYAAKEIGPMVWVWMGNLSDAIEEKIPELPVHDMDKWTHVVGPYNHLEGSYILMQENLCDLSHLPFLHAETFKFPQEYTAAPIKVEQDGDQITFYRELEDWNLLRPFFHPNLDFGKKKVIYKSGGRYESPSTNKGYGLLIPIDENGLEQPEVGHYVSHYVTPETESSTHYFWFIARNYELSDIKYSKKQGDMVQAGFEEDLFAIRHLQRIIENDTHTYREIGIKADKPGVMMRKIIKKLSEE